MEQLGAAPSLGPFDDLPAPPARRRTGPSIRPALVVVAIAAGLIVLFGVGAALTGSGPPPAHRAAGHVAGTSLAAEPASGPLRPIEKLGTPPDDILQALVVPAGARTLSSTPWDGQTQYSGTMRFSVTSSQASVVSFYKAELRSLGWAISSIGAAHDQPGATEVLAQKASTDGWYWEVGAVVAPTTFGTGAATDTTQFTLELFEVPDAQ